MINQRTREKEIQKIVHSHAPKSRFTRITGHKSIHTKGKCKIVETNLSRLGTENPLLVFEFQQQPSILSLVHGYLIFHGHKELIPTQTKLDQAGFSSQPTVKAPSPPHQIQHGQTFIPPHSQRQLP